MSFPGRASGHQTFLGVPEPCCCVADLPIFAWGPVPLFHASGEELKMSAKRHST